MRSSSPAWHFKPGVAESVLAQAAAIGTCSKVNVWKQATAIGSITLQSAFAVSLAEVCVKAGKHCEAQDLLQNRWGMSKSSGGGDAACFIEAKAVLVDAHSDFLQGCHEAALDKCREASQQLTERLEEICSRVHPDSPGGLSFWESAGW